MASIFHTQLDWNAAFDQLIRFHQKKSIKDLRTNNGKRHLLLYNYGRYMDYLIHLQLDNNSHIKGWMVSRENSCTSQPHVEQIANLGNMLCHIIWLQTAHSFNSNSDPNSATITTGASNTSSSTRVTVLNGQNSSSLTSPL